MNRKVFLHIVLLLLSLPLAAQEMSVKSFEETIEQTANLSENLHQDLNGDYGGLVKVMVASPKAEFEGFVLEQCQYGAGEYWVFMAKNSRRLKIRVPNLLPLEVDFQKYGIEGVKSRVTYKLIVTLPQTGTAVEQDDGIRYLAMTVEPKNSVVYVDDVLQQVENGEMVVRLPIGSHRYQVSAAGYATQEGTVDMAGDNQTLIVRLASTMAMLRVECATKGAQIFVNGQQRGTTSWSGSLTPGNYEVEARLDGYRPRKQSVALAQSGNETVRIPELTMITGRLNIDCRPIGSEVYVDGKKMGTTPNLFRDIQVGLRRVEILKEGYQAITQTVNIKENEQAEISGSLSEMSNFSGVYGTIDKETFMVGEENNKEYNELKELMHLHPNDHNYRVMMGNWLLKNGKEKEALSEYLDVLKKEPDNEMAQISLYDYYEGKNYSLAMQYARALLLNQRVKNDSKVTVLKQIIAKSEEHGGDSIPVLTLFDSMLKMPQQNADIAGLKAAYMSLKQMPDSLVDLALLDVLEIEPDNAGARIQLLQDVWATKDYDRVIALCKPALEYNPDNIAFYYFLGLAYSQKGEIDKSIDAFRRGVSQITSDSNRDLVSDFYAIMGDMLHEKKLHEEAFAAYDSSLQWKSNNIGCLNNYAYYLCVLNMDLPKAEQMSYRTVRAEPKNSTYLDTYAWILFREERFEEARIYIDQALANDSTVSAVIIEHAGDIYMMVSQPDKAVEYWEKALEMDSENALLQRKIKLKRYIDNSTDNNFMKK